MSTHESVSLLRINVHVAYGGTWRHLANLGKVQWRYGRILSSRVNMTFDLLDPKSMLVGAFAIIKNHSRELKSGRPNHGSGGFVIFLHPYT